jgi:cytidine deaminase
MPKSVTKPVLLRRLEAAARKAAERAYAPYSKFRVGAAVQGGSGRIYAGCNVENASYGLCNCAERTAVFAAVTAGETRITAVAVYTPTANVTLPCGACRQVLHEFGPEAAVVGICDGEERVSTSVAALLPLAFGPADLRG